jgi:hypothetical protein
MAEQLHKKFSDDQIKELLERYLDKKIKRAAIEKVLGIGKTRFFGLLKQYRDSPIGFSIEYVRKNATNKIAPEVEENIMAELAAEKRLIQDPEVPVRTYNYSYVKDRLAIEHGKNVALSTIISRAKAYGYYQQRKQKAYHDREVATNYAGELIQHDSSHHKFSPYADKWYLITSLDDFSRYILYATLVEKETSLAHIAALEAVALKYGLAASYYVDSHSIFRFVQGRDSFWRKHYSLTDETDPQWKQVLDELGINVEYALSPQAKGKIERPYRWIQDRLVRTCAREGINEIADAQKVLEKEIHRYNYKQVHSTTGEVPYFRFQRAVKEKVSLFRDFSLPYPYKSTKDIFALRLNRIIDAYRKISISKMEISLNGKPRDSVNIRIYPLNNQCCELRFWCNKELIDIKKLKNSDLKMVHF